MNGGVADGEFNSERVGTGEHTVYATKTKLSDKADDIRMLNKV
jgi:hypothetical protein